MYMYSKQIPEANLDHSIWRNNEIPISQTWRKIQPKITSFGAIKKENDFIYLEPPKAKKGRLFDLIGDFTMSKQQNLILKCITINLIGFEWHLL